MGPGKNIGDIHVPNLLLEAVAWFLIKVALIETDKIHKMVLERRRPLSVVPEGGALVGKEVGVAAGGLKHIMHDSRVICGSSLLRPEVCICTSSPWGRGPPGLGAEKRQ